MSQAFVQRMSRYLNSRLYNGFLDTILRRPHEYAMYRSLLDACLETIHDYLHIVLRQRGLDNVVTNEEIVRWCHVYVRELVSP